MDVPGRLAQEFQLDRQAIDRLARYVAAVEEAPLNLTAWRGAVLWERGVLDSLVLGGWVGQHAGRGLDIGSGGGFPGMVLAIAYPAGHWVLMDSRERRCAFLEATAQVLGLDNVRVVRGRAEAWVREEPGQRESFDWVTMRAVAGTSVSLELGLPYLKQGGRMMLVKGPGGPDELAAASALLDRLGGDLVDWVAGTVQNAEGQWDQIAVIDKVRETPALFPRSAKGLGT